MNKQQNIFNQLRKTPTELSEQDVEKMINAFSGMPLRPLDASKWKDLLTLNNTIMITIPTSLVIGLMIFTQSFGETKPITESQIPNDVQLELPKEIQQDDQLENIIAEEATSLKDVGLKDRKTVNSDILTHAKLVEFDDSGKHFLISKPPIIVEQPTNNSDKEDELITDVNDEKNLSSTRTINEGPVLELYPDFEKSPILSDFKMKRLRKKLYKNLMADEIILSKIPVVMRLPGDKIYVNNIEIPKNLIPKYVELTKEVRSGPNRKIKFSRRHVIVGDFNLDGFYGAGVGLLNDELFEKVATKEPELIGKNDRNEENTFKKDYKALFDFANSKRSPGGAKMPLFGVNMHYKNSKDLWDKLNAQLSKDEYINDVNEFVVIQLKKDKLIINGIILSEDKKTEYDGIIGRFKIKPGNQREILLSKSMICIGDYNGYEFTGSISTFY